MKGKQLELYIHYFRIKLIHEGLCFPPPFLYDFRERQEFDLMIERDMMTKSLPSNTNKHL